MLTLKRLKNLYSCDPKTGKFTNIFPRQKVKAGTRAGCLTTNGYRVIWIDGKSYREHRLAWFYVYGSWPDGELDHIDGNRSNNAISNLRLATRSQNRMNSKVSKNNKLGIKGVCRCTNSKKYRAQIQKNGKLIHLGYYNTEEEATEAYDEAAKKLFGEFARVA